MKQKKSKKAKIEIRECAWIDGQAVMWQGHAYWDGHRIAEPLISGLPAKSLKEAKKSLMEALYEYMYLSIEGKGAMEMSRSRGADNVHVIPEAKATGTGRRERTK